jgi:hypothetical protein
VKLHPRAVDDPIARAVLREYPALPSRVVRRGPVAKWLRRADCVLSCVSSAGIDATLARVPVIQLLPSGSGDVLPYQHWGMLGTARSDAELQRLLLRALDTGAPADAAPHPNVFHDLRGGRRITPRFRKGTVPFWAPRSAWSRENRDSPQIISGVFHDLGASAAARIADTILAARHSEQRNEERAGRALPTAFSPHAAIMVHKAAAPATRGSAGRWEAELTER